MSLRNLFGLAIGAWLAMLAFQSVVGPWDGYATGYLQIAGARIALGPLLHGWLAPFAEATLSAPATRVAYVCLLLSACSVNTWLVARLRRAGEPELLRLRSWLIATTALLWALAFFDLPHLSNDLYLYQTYGDMLERGLNPYVAIPQRHLPAEALAGIPWTAQPSAYGPAALLMFRAASALGAGTALGFWLLKLFVVLPWATLLLVVSRTQALAPAERLAALAWLGLNPLLLLEMTQNAHLESWTGPILLLTVLLLRRRGAAWAAGAGLCVGLVGAFKLSLLVVAPAVFVDLFRPAASDRSRSERLRASIAFTATLLATLALCYLPLWQGLATFDGLRAESQKVLLSPYFVLSLAFGLSAPFVQALGLLGTALALIAGAWVRWRGLPLEVALITALVVQALLGRTFLHSWYLCPPLILMALLRCYDAPRRRELAMRVRMALCDEVFWLVFSVSAIVGRYAIVVLAQNRGDAAQTQSVLCMLLPPLIYAILVDRSHAPERTSARRKRPTGASGQR
ncbi:MAG TPA: hypothetical protein VII72_13635 [Myxococcota bacterium]